MFHEKKKSKNPFSLFILLVENRTWIISPFTHIYIWTQSVQVQQQVSGGHF